MYGDFIDYSSLNGWSTEDNVHQIYSGKEKTSDKNLYCATWQSLATIGKSNNSPKKDNELSANDYFEQFDYVIIDEAHSLKATEICRIVELCTNASYRIGLTGTTSKTKANIKTIIGLTGPVNDLITTRELIERKEVANFDIKCLVLKYDKETSKQLKDYKYKDEVKYIISNQKRNNFIKNLTISMKSNSLVLFNFVEHGKLLHKMISESKFIGDRNVYLIYGAIDGEERERIRHIIETEKNAIIIASVQTTGTGVSIKNLHNIIFCTGTKSSIRVLQSIGRAIRLHNDKEKATIYDIVDDLRIKKHKNFAVKHFLERVKIYNEQQFNYKLKNIDFPQN
jgi:superfamily II DNA or RNA helicase